MLPTRLSLRIKGGCHFLYSRPIRSPSVFRLHSSLQQPFLPSSLQPPRTASDSSTDTFNNTSRKPTEQKTRCGRGLCAQLSHLRPEWHPTLLLFPRLPPPLFSHLHQHLASIPSPHHIHILFPPLPLESSANSHTLPPVVRKTICHTQPHDNCTVYPNQQRLSLTSLPPSFPIETAKMSNEPKEQFRDSSSLIIAAPIPKSQQQPGKANYKILLLQRSRMGTSAAAHVFPGMNTFYFGYG